MSKPDALDRPPVHRPLRFLTDYHDHDALEYGTALECPSCGERFTRSTTVEVYPCVEGDQRHGLAIREDGSTAAVECSGNPSRWEQGVRVSFECTCEPCGRPFAVVIGQYKGQTLISYEVAPGSPAATRREPITVSDAPPDWRARVRPLDEETLLAGTKRPRQEAEANQIAGLMRHTERRGLTDHDLIALGVELRRLHRSRANCPGIGALSMREAGWLFEIVHAWERHL